MENEITKLKHIKYILKEVEDGLVSFQILEMDERFRADKGVTIEYPSSNGLLICSDINTEIAGDFIYLRGSNKDKDCIISECGGNKLDIHRIHEALEGWDENWEGFSGDEKDKEVLILTEEERKTILEKRTAVKHIKDIDNKAIDLLKAAHGYQVWLTKNKKDISLSSFLHGFKYKGTSEIDKYDMVRHVINMAKQAAVYLD